jgi:ribosomal protein S18 acetylase RimI-like enzyme
LAANYSSLGMKTEISEVQEDDIAILQQLFLSVRRNTFDWLDTSEYKLEDFNKQTVNEFILVARCENIVVGFISLWIPDSFIHHLYIKNEHKATGVGKALLQEIQNTMPSPIKLKCLKKNKIALNFYNKNGFEEIENGVGTEGEFSILQYIRSH